MRKTLAAILTVLLIATAFGTASVAEALPAAAIDSLTIYKGATINNMDYTTNTASASFAVFAYTGEGLYKWATDGSKLVLGLADSEDISEDGLTRTYHIRDDAYYSNGTKITANDFEYAWKRLADPATAAEYASMTEFAGLKNAAAVCAGEMSVDELGVKATDESTLVVTLDTPVNFFPSLMTFATFYPLNQAFVEAAGDQFGLSIETTLCSGPYQLTEWTAGGTTESVERNPYYYALSDLTVNTINWQIITEVSSGVMGYEQGTLDVMELTSEFVSQYKDNPGFHSLLQSTIYWLQYYCGDGSPFADMNLRLAFSYAINKQAICVNILKDGSIPANFYFPTQFQPLSGGGTIRDYAAELGYGDDGQGHYLFEDDTKAAEYFEAYKAAAGVDKVEIELIFTNTDTYNYVSAYLKQELESALPGLTLNLQPLESNDRIARSKAGDYQVVMGGWGADYQDASNFVMLDTSDSAFNYGKWVSVDNAYDALNAKYLGEDATDEYARAKDLLDMEKILLTEGAKTPLWQKATCYLIRPDYIVPMTSVGGWLYQYTTAAN